MEVFFWLFMFWCGLLLFGVIAGPMMANSANKKERERKLELMRQYPHLAAEIYKSIDEQEAHHRAKMDAFHKGFGDSFDQLGNSFQKAADRRRKNRSMALKFGLAIARKFVK